MAKEAKDKETKEDKEIKNKVEITDSGPCKKKVSIEVPEATIKAALDEQYNDLRREANIPGFRRGRAPIRLIEKRFGSDVTAQVKLKLLADATETALKDNEIDNLGDPDINHEDIELPEKGAMKFEFEVEVRPDFKLPSLKGIKVEKPKIEVTDAQIDEEIKIMRERAGIWAPKESGKVEADEQVIADAVLKVEGATEDERHDNLEIFVRQSGFVGGVPVEKLDELLVGASIGDVKTTKITVPKTFFKEDYRGKEVEVEITIKEIKKLEPAALDEGLFKRCGVDSLEELKEAIGDARKMQEEQAAKQSMAEQVHAYLSENTKFDLPADVVADQSTSILQRQYTNLLMRGLQRQQIDEQMEELRASSETQAAEQLRIFFIMDKVAEKLKVEVTEEEINGHIAQVAAQRGRRPEKMKEELARDGSLGQFSIQIREQKCIEKLLEDAEIKDLESGKTIKTTAKKTKTKKATAKKPAAKKTETKKTTTKKTAARKPAAKKVSVKTTIKKKVEKEIAMKVAAKRASRASATPKRTRKKT